jgi:hypothetical protein
VGGSKNSTRSVRSSTKSDFYGEEWDLCQIRTSALVEKLMEGNANVDMLLEGFKIIITETKWSQIRDSEGLS